MPGFNDKAAISGNSALLIEAEFKLMRAMREVTVTESGLSVSQDTFQMSNSASEEVENASTQTVASRAFT